MSVMAAGYRDPSLSTGRKRRLEFAGIPYVREAMRRKGCTTRAMA